MKTAASLVSMTRTDIADLRDAYAFKFAADAAMCSVCVMRKTSHGLQMITLHRDGTIRLGDVHNQGQIIAA